MSREKKQIMQRYVSLLKRYLLYLRNWQDAVLNLNFAATGDGTILQNIYNQHLIEIVHRRSPSQIGGPTMHLFCKGLIMSNIQKLSVAGRRKNGYCNIVIRWGGHSGGGTVAGIYHLRRLQIKRSGRLGQRAVLALDCCPCPGDQKRG